MTPNVIMPLQGHCIIENVLVGNIEIITEFDTHPNPILFVGLSPKARFFFQTCFGAIDHFAIGVELRI